MSIQNYLNQIKTAVFGKDVRQSIHDAIKQCYDDASVDHDNANMEVKLARGTHETLNDRITENEKNQENLSSQLETKASKKDLEIERNRINLLTKIEAGETEGNTELLDIRNGADGVVYNTAGESVREQFKNVNNKVLNTDTIIMNNSLSEEKKGTSVNFENTRSDIPLFIKGFNKTINNLFDKNEVEMLDGFWQTDTGMMVAGDGNYGFLFDVSMYTGETITVSEITPTPGDAKYISLFSGKPQANSIPLVFDTFKVSTEFEGRSYASVPVIENAKYLFVWYGAYAENENPNYYLDTMQIEVGINPSKYVPHDGFKITACGKNVFSAWKDKYYVGDRPSGQQLILMDNPLENEIRFRGNGGSYAECYYKIYNLIPNTYYTASAKVIENNAFFNARCYGGTTDENGTLTVTFVGCDSETLEYYHFITFSNIQVELGEEQTGFEKYISNEITINNDEFPISELYAYNGITNILSNMKIDVQDLDADFLVFSGHKMLAPLGIGVLYGKREILNNMTPFLMGGDMIEYVYEQDTTFAPLPNKFEAGTQNVEGVVGLGAAIDYIQKIGYDKIQELENDVVSYARQELSKLDYLTLYLTPNTENHSGVISFNIKGVHPHDVASILDSENVCVRSGNHCAQPLMRFLGIDSTCRASFYFYNTREDVDRLVHALNKAYDMFKKFLK